MDHDATNGENFAMGSLAAAATVCVMIPLDTVKTRIVTQVRGCVCVYVCMYVF